MLSGKIYLRSGNDLVEMHEEAYDAEADLQRLLADHPDLLAGDQVRPDAPRRWALIQREAGIEDTAGGLFRWSLDHLFIDQDSTPTLVEVKRSSNTQIRREVVGQMLDYAANVVVHWPAGELRRRFEARAADPAAELERALGIPGTPEAIDRFWEEADRKLQAREIRMLFVADVIPIELQRIVEFLNGVLARGEVLAIEVRQFVGEGHETLVPRVIGRTAAAEQATFGTPRARTWTLEEFLAATAAEGAVASRVVGATVDWLRDRGLPIDVIGRGKGGPLYVALPDGRDGQCKAVSVGTDGIVAVNYVYLKQAAPFDQVAMRLELNRRLNAIPGVAIPERYAVDATWPSIRPEVLATQAAMAAFLDILAWAADLVASGAANFS